MEEIKVGEYVRDRAGNIAKVMKNHNTVFEIELNTGARINQFEGFIVKHSKNIKDLIECGDYVNGYKVISVDYDVIDDETECIELDLNNNYQYNFISVRQIKSIVTHEQFEQNSYKV